MRLVGALDCSLIDRSLTRRLPSSYGRVLARPSLMAVEHPVDVRAASVSGCRRIVLVAGYRSLLVRWKEVFDHGALAIARRGASRSRRWRPPVAEGGLRPAVPGEACLCAPANASEDRVRGRDACVQPEEERKSMQERFGFPAPEWESRQNTKPFLGVHVPTDRGFADDGGVKGVQSEGGLPAGAVTKGGAPGSAIGCLRDRGLP